MGGDFKIYRIGATQSYAGAGVMGLDICRHTFSNDLLCSVPQTFWNYLRK